MKVLQVFHDYHAPFPHICRLYGSYFDNPEYQLENIFLRGASKKELCASLPGKTSFYNWPGSMFSGLKIKAIFRLIKVLREEKPDLIIAHRFKPIYLSVIASYFSNKTIVIGVAHEVGMFERYGRRLFANLTKSKLRIIGVSEFVRKDIISNLPDFPKSYIESLPNSIDVDKAISGLVERDNARSALGIPINAKVIGTMGRLIPKKNHQLLIEAFAAWPKGERTGWILVIMGEGRIRESLENLADSLGVGDQTCFLGFVENGDRHITLFDLFVLPSLREAFGMVLIEAMSAGVTVVAPNTGAAPEVVNDSSYIFDKLTPESLLDKIKFSVLNLADPLDLQEFVRNKYSLPVFQKKMGVILKNWVKPRC